MSGIVTEERKTVCFLLKQFIGHRIQPQGCKHRYAETLAPELYTRLMLGTQKNKCMLLTAADISHDFIKHKIPKGNLHTNMDLTQRLCVRTDVLIHSSDLFI